MNLVIVISFVASFIFSWLISQCLFVNAEIFGRNKKAYSERVRLHKKGVPRLGGMAIYGAFYLTLSLIYIFAREYFQDYHMKFVGIFLASTLIMICGLYDDLIRRLGYRVKFLLQILAILIIIAFGYNINIITNPFGGRIYIGMLGIPFIVIWMLMIMNAINLIDGLDGLACGIATIVSLSFLIIVFYQGDIFLQ